MKFLTRFRSVFLELDLALHFLLSSKNRLQAGVSLSLAGLVLSTGILVVAMSAMSGFEKTLREVMIDVTGHVQVVKRGRADENWLDFEARLKELTPRIQSSMRFLFTQAIAARDGKIAGVMLQGMDFVQMKKTLDLSHRVREGSLDGCSSLGFEGSAMAAEAASGRSSDFPICGFIGQGLAKRFGLSAGDSFNVVVPVADSFDPLKFHRKRSRFLVAAVLDFGKNDYNERLMVTELISAQKILSVGDRYTGLVLKLDSDSTRPLVSELQTELGYGYILRDWREANENLFEAAALEKRIIFFVISILVVVAAFNVASSLYVMTVQRLRDISLLRALGLSQKRILRLFQFLGLSVSFLGSFFGLILGFVFGLGFEWIQNRFHLLSGEVYKIDHIYVDFKLVDILIILFWSNLICFLAVLFPAQRGARAEIVEGFKNAT